MKVRVEISKILKPFYDGKPPSTQEYMPLSVFDNVTHNSHMPLLYVYRPPTPSNSILALGLQRALSVYREVAGRFGRDDNGNLVILLNDEGARFIEASFDSDLDQVFPNFDPSPSLLSLHPELDGVAELAQFQLTRFKCGSLVVGFTGHHVAIDGFSASNLLVAWGQACRGLEISPFPFRDRTIFAPRDPPKFMYEHGELEFTNKLEKFCPMNFNNLSNDVVVHKFHFTLEFISKLKAKASPMNGSNKPYSTFEVLVAHLWRSITKARAVNNYETTQVKISVNGRRRLNPKVPNEYFGNLVLWAYPRTMVKDLLSEPISYAAKVIHDAVTNVNNNYFKSFIDFASYKAKEEDLIPVADIVEPILCPNLEVDSWLGFPFYDLDFGGGSPYVFMPSYFPIEGMMFLVPSFIGDGSIDAFVPMFFNNLDLFKQVCYYLD